VNPSTRWTIGILVAVAIAILLFLWSRSDQKPAPAKGEIAKQPAPKPEPSAAPTAPATDGPATVVILFAYNQPAVRPGEAAKLDDLAARAKGRASDRLEAVGHADRIGGPDYNLGLSKRRAEAVRAYLAGKGVEAKRVRAEAKGKAEAVTGDACKNMGPESRENRKLIECLQRDRRVEVKLVAR
jgi:OOP family OmpA-OmpF porin